MSFFGKLKRKKDVKGDSEKEADVLVEKKVFEKTKKDKEGALGQVKKVEKKPKDSVGDKKDVESTDEIPTKIGKDKKDKKSKESKVNGKDKEGALGQKTVRSNAHSVLKRPFVSEKAASAEANGVYTFVVDIKANKFNIKESIKSVYGIMPKKVRIISMEGKRVSAGRKRGKKSDWKKAIVTLPKGKTINIHEGV